MYTLDAHMKEGTRRHTLHWIHSAHPNLFQNICPTFWTVFGKPKKAESHFSEISMLFLSREKEGLFKPKEFQILDLHFTL